MVSARIRAVGALGALALLGALVVPAARADDTIRTQPFSEVLGIPYLHEHGLTGEGVTIGIIDGRIDTSIPELAGSDITVHDVCPVENYEDESITHGSAMTALIASKDYGVAPGAKIHFYTRIGLATERPTDECAGHRGLGYAINQAIDDGADIISISFAGFRGDVEYALARAEMKGIPVVVAAGNESVRNAKDSLGSMNTTIGVGSTDGDGVHADFSNTGESVTISAPGFATVRNLPDNAIRDMRGTSVSTALVSGFLAVAMQKWPDATGDQIIRLLLETATRGDDEERDDVYGYGLLSPQGLITTDPTKFEDAHPLLDKGVAEWLPTKDQLADYSDGLVDPTVIDANDADYVYRGDNDAILANFPEITRLGTSPRYHR